MTEHPIFARPNPALARSPQLFRKLSTRTSPPKGSSSSTPRTWAISSKKGTPKDQLLAQIKTDDIGWNTNNAQWSAPARLDPFYDELSKTK